MEWINNLCDHTIIGEEVLCIDANGTTHIGKCRVVWDLNDESDPVPNDLIEWWCKIPKTPDAEED